MSPHPTTVQPDEQCASLTRDFFLVQRRRGHRYSVDDLLVAHLACTRARQPERILDLGCGIGSVLLMVGWAFPDAQLVGIEAQEQSVNLAGLNIRLNDCEARVDLRFGDLRDQAMVDSLGTFDLITATPPYFDPKAATPCADPQRAHAKFEFRGGIEDYAQSAARVLRPGGLFVGCAGALVADRTLRALQQAGLNLCWLRPVLPGPNRRPFLELFEAKRERTETTLAEPLVLREADGRRSREHATIRERFGLAASEY